ncbi:MAG: hypothetical protein NT023_25390 [Armatimonadetes bacterium]|nr:hypothetical protein [Armatimonadota bacterium]
MTVSKVLRPAGTGGCHVYNISIPNRTHSFGGVCTQRGKNSTLHHLIFLTCGVIQNKFAAPAQKICPRHLGVMEAKAESSAYGA